MLTAKKQRFAAAFAGGASKTSAAIAAGYSEKNADVTGCKLVKDADVVAELARLGAGGTPASSDHATQPEHPTGDKKTPLQIMESIANDEAVPLELRLRAAQAAAPYIHPKVGEAGKKDGRKKAAGDVAGGKFAPSAPPKLVVSNKR